MFFSNCVFHKELVYYLILVLTPGYFCSLSRIWCPFWPHSMFSKANTHLLFCVHKLHIGEWKTLSEHLPLKQLFAFILALIKSHLILIVMFIEINLYKSSMTIKNNYEYSEFMAKYVYMSLWKHVIYYVRNYVCIYS